MSALPRPAGTRFVPLDAARIPEILRIEEAVYPFPWTAGNFADSLRNGHSAWTIEDGEGVVLAYAVAMLCVDEAHLLNLAVAPAEQRRGLGAEMLAWMMRTLREYGARSLLLEVRPSNTAAQRLYLRTGFSAIGRRRGYYPDHGGREDAIVMRVPLEAA